MGHYYVDMMCDKCGRLICTCPNIEQPKIKNSIKERAKKVPLHTKLYVDLLFYALDKKYLTHKDFNE